MMLVFAVVMFALISTIILLPNERMWLPARVGVICLIGVVPWAAVLWVIYRWNEHRPVPDGVTTSVYCRISPGPVTHTQEVITGELFVDRDAEGAIVAVRVHQHDHERSSGDTHHDRQGGQA